MTDASATPHELSPETREAVFTPVLADAGAAGASSPESAAPGLTLQEHDAAPLPRAPKRQSGNALLLRHGTSGRLLLSLQRYALLGWIAFFALLSVFVATVVLSTLFARQPVIAVDEAGRVLGSFEYLDASQRTVQEHLAAARYFTQHYLSLNSSSIDEDYAEAMNLMAKPLFDASLLLVKDGYLARVKHAGAVAQVSFTSEGASLLSRDGLHSTVRVKGSIHVRAGAGAGGAANEAREQLFDLTLDLTAVARSSLSTFGFRVDRVTDN